MGENYSILLKANNMLVITNFDFNFDSVRGKDIKKFNIYKAVILPN